ncbi:MAG: DUF4838 domain-containing protein, partial [Planctomycetota bacterium]
NKYTTAHQHGGQLCMSNEAMRKQYAANIIAYAKAEPSVRTFGMSANDGGGFCECEPCEAWDTPRDEWTEAAKNSTSLYLTDRTLKFQRDVAQRVLREIPDARFQYAAYHTSAVPPVREQVPDEFDLIGYYNYWPYRFLIDKDRAMVEDSLKGWGEKTSHYFLSTFYLGYGNYGLPWSTPASVAWLIDEARKNRFEGLLLYVSHLDPSKSTTDVGRPEVGARGGDIWVLSQLAWDPTLDASELYDEFYAGCFGPEAGEYVRGYFETLDRFMSDEIKKMPGFRRGIAHNQRKITEAGLAAAREACAEWIRLATEAASSQDERYRWRVAQIATNWRYAELTLD